MNYAGKQKTMYVTRLNTLSRDTDGIERQLAELTLRPPAWVLMYGTDDAPFQRIMNQLNRRWSGVPIFGATSFKGVFTPSGFTRDVALLVGEARDGITLAVSLQEAGAAQAKAASHRACQEIELKLKRRPSTLLLHATPGFEERVLEGVRSAYGNEVPVYGGSAADDSLAGRWQVFANGVIRKEGLLLIGVSSLRPPMGSFLGGFLPTEHSGTITKVDARAIHEIDGRPAAAVYNTWTDGAIARELTAGGNVLQKTNLFPLARSLGDSHGMPRRLLSHPHEVIAGSQVLTCFTEFSRGDKVTLMTSTREPLVTRVRRAVQRARSSTTTRPQGALLIYCGGSLSGLLDQADKISSEFAAELNGAPFIGIATFGEQGAFFSKAESWHGNLMCSAVLF
jgi:hypothetical protein